MTTEAQRALWEGDVGAFWAAHDRQYDAMFAPFTAAILDAARIVDTDRVLDVGCGCGESTRQAAARADQALGLDLSAAMIARARERAAAAGLRNVTFEQRDVDEPGALALAAFDVVISQLGVMFFADPVATFTALAAALRPGGRLVFVCWRDRDRNPYRTIGAQALAGFAPAPPPPDPSKPGAFSLADADRIRAVLGAAGFADPSVTELTGPLPMGADVESAARFLYDDAVDDGLPTDDEALVLARLQTALTPYADVDGVRLPCSAWLVRTTLA